MLNRPQKNQVLRDHIEARAKGRLNEMYEVSFASPAHSCKTGCWRWDKHLKKNVILINEAIDEHCITRHPVTRGRPTPFGGNFATKVKRHEDAHSLFTDPDLDGMKKKLTAAGPIPWVLLNIFEDARIEFQYRRKFGGRFGWMAHEHDLVEKLDMEAAKPEDEREMKSLADPEFRPETIFHGIYHIEGEAKRLTALKNACYAAAGAGPYSKDKKNAANYYNFIRQFVVRAQRCEATDDLIPLMKRWVEFFGIPKGAAIIGVGMPGSAISEEDAKKFGLPGGVHGEDFIEAAAAAEDAGLGSLTGKSESEPVKKPEPVKPIHGRGTSASLTGAAHDEAALVADGELPALDDSMLTPLTPAEEALMKHTGILARTPDMLLTSIRRAAALAPLLRRALTGGISDKMKKMSPSKRFSASAWVRKSDRPFRGKGPTHDGRRKIVVMYDCSGSMHGHHHTNGRILLMALSRLARTRDIEGSVIFCWGANQRVPLPLSDELITRLDTPGGCEGFARAMRDHKDEIVAADLYIAYTDACLTDAPVDRKFWREHNLPCVALYCGDTSYLSSLQKYFERAIIREKIEDVAVELVKHVRYAKA